MDEHTARRLLAALLVGCLPALQGCFPAAAVGMTAGALIGSDRRTVAAQAVDQEIEHRLKRRLAAEIDAAAHVNATSYNRWLLLTGEAPTEAQRAKAEAIAREMPYTPTVINEIQVRTASGIGDRSEDARLTGVVKSRLAGSDAVLPTHVKVVSEAGVVYLMGLLTEAEAKSALDIASRSAGVKKVVNVIQLIRDPAEVRREETAQPQTGNSSATPLPPTPPPVTPDQRPRRF